MDKEIVDFINEHHLLTLATSKDNIPYCCNAFYVFDEGRTSLIFSSDTTTKHAKDFTLNPKVAAGISLETKVVGKIQGVQLLGEIIELKGNDLERVSKQYLKAYPYARLMGIHLWEMKLNFAKMTHNLLGFGEKLTWEL
ncbi:MAG: hypothetical protein HOA52_07440 [Flavobacteriales bacterium]|nr:hypothetical protein [Flavobacteriales bacterium]